MHPAIHAARVLRSIPVVIGLLVLTSSPGVLAQEGPSDAPAPSPVVRGLSWDVMGGGVPTSGALVHAEAGFSGLPTVAYHHSLRRGFSIGGLVGFDYGHYRPRRGFFESLVIAAPLRWTLFRDSDWSAGLRADPGLRLAFFDGTDVGLMVNISGHAAYTLEHRIIVGGGIELPVLLNIPTRSGRSTSFAVPVLVGAIAEFHVAPPLGLTVDMKLGPHIATSGVRVGLKMMLGAVYRL